MDENFEFEDSFYYKMQSRSCTVTDAFNSQLKSLCVKEFPCGFGTWRITDFTNSTKKKDKTASLVVSPTSRAEVTAQQETTEGLQELSITVPYDVDCTWSNEASTLREIAVKTPEKLSKEFILNHFKSLRIVDKRVTDIDEGLLQFTNLEKFTLSANLISTVDSKKLPADLQELELSANQISDISRLCINPPPLIHLGLSYNKIESIPSQMKPQTWSHLLSLDVSYNNLSCLEDTINILKLLPKLRNLVLQGNPLVLVPGYRGYIIDSIRHLTILDDNRISADEKHYFKGLAKLKDIALDESRLTVAVDVITGVKPPEEIEDPESQMEWPRIEHKYHVEFKFLELPFEQRVSSPAPSAPTLSITGPDEEESKTIPSTDVTQSIDSEPGSLLKNATESLTWTEESIDVNYCKDFHTQKLIELRDFLKEGIDFNVIETKHSYVQEDPNALPEDAKHITSAKGHQESKDKRKKSGNKDKTDKRKDSAKPKEKGKDGKGKGKGKHEEMELFELPREHRTLGSCHVNLSTFLDGEFEVTNECICEEEKTNAEPKADDTRSVASGKHGEKKKSHKGDPAEKPGKGQKQASENKRASQGKAVKGGKEEKGKGKAAKEEETIHDEEEEAVPPPPLAIKVTLRLHHWKSAKEAMVALTS